MKKFLLLVSILITLSAKSQTNIYHPFPDSNAVWNINYWSEFQCGNHPPCGQYNYFSYVINGDTLINAQNYHKLFTPLVQYSSYGFPCGCSNYWRGVGYNGCIRQDASSKMVWYINPGSVSEQLLYNFNAGIGDTIGYPTTALAFCNYHPLIVSSIDSVLIGTDYRKRWHLTFFTEVVIEGIGSSRGILETNCIYPNVVLQLTCFTQDGQTLYPDTLTNCPLITGVGNIYPESFLSTVSPNPFTNELSVATKRNEISEIILYDIASRILLRQKFINSVSLNTEQLAKGLYLYEVRSKNGVIKKGKVVKD